MYIPYNPRAEALNRFGQGMGSGLGDILSRFMESRQFQKQSQGLTAETPINEVLQKLSTVSPQLREQYLSPQVQQRLQQERLGSTYQKIRNDLGDITSRNAPEYMRRIAEAALQVPGANIGDTLNVLMQAMSRAGQGKGYRDLGGSNVVPEITRKESPSGTNTRLNEPFLGGMLDQPSTYQEPAGRQAPFGQMGGPAPTGRIPFAGGDYRTPNYGAAQTQPMTQQEYGDAYGRMFALTGDPQASATFAENLRGLTKDQREAEMQNLTARETGRKINIEEENRVRDAAKTLLDRDYPADPQTGVRPLSPFLQDMLVDVMISARGTDEQRYAKGNEYIKDLQAAQHQLSRGETRPNIARFRPDALKKFLKGQQSIVKTVLNDPRTPQMYRRRIMDQFKSVLMANGDGTLEAEAVVNPLNDNTGKIINSVPEAPKTFKEGGKYGVQANRKFEQQRREGIQEIADTIERIASKDPWASPLLLRAELLEKGWDEASIREAFGIADQKNVLSELQRAQVAELSTQQKPGLNSIFWGDPSLQTMLDVLIRGKK